MPVVFAYGGNTNPNQLRNQYLSHIILGKGYLPNYTLTFRTYTPAQPCKDTFTILEECYCNAETSSSLVLEGMLLNVSEDDLHKMDKQECLGSIYERKQVEVILGFEKIPCWIYTMISPGETSKPSERYLRVVLHGYETFSFDSTEKIHHMLKN